MKTRRNIALLILITILLALNNSCSAFDKARIDIAEKLLRDFKVYVEKNPTYLNLVLASDKANGILSVYKVYLKRDDVQWVSRKYEQIQRSLNFSTVYFGYSRSGLHFIAMAQPQMRHNYDYEEVMNSIRGLEDETVFLSEISFLSERYYAIDLYVEDLLEKRKVIKIGISINEDGVTQIPIVDLNDANLNTLLSKYNRKLIYSDLININKWKLYLFRESAGFPTITISHEGEEIILSY
jgi:hypothetical protein